MGSAKANPTLHIFFFPFLAYGLIIPTTDMATIITPPLNASFMSKAIGKAKAHNNVIHIQTIEFPCEEAGLPKGCENMDSIPSPDLISTFFKATRLLKWPLEQLLLEHHPNCVVADAFYPWAADSASKLGIPSIVFHGTCFFTLCATDHMGLSMPYKNVSSDSECFVIPHLPSEIKMKRKHMPAFVKNKQNSKEFIELLEEAKESQVKSYGVVVNSFYELEKAYADYYRNELGKKAWHIGPVSLCNRDMEEKAHSEGTRATSKELREKREKLNEE